MRTRRLLIGALVALGWPTAALAQDSYSDPSGSGPIVGALQGSGHLAGTAATVVAVIAVAVVGFLMLAGRMKLALWGDGHHRLLHPVRRCRHRRRHPVDR